MDFWNQGSHWQALHVLGEPGVVAAEPEGREKQGPSIYMEAQPGLGGIQGCGLWSACTIASLQGPQGVSGHVPAAAGI